jgi:hypothetical protein
MMCFAANHPTLHLRCLSVACLLTFLLSGCGEESDSYFPLGQRLVLSYDIVEQRSSENHHRKKITQYSAPLTMTLAGNRETVHQWLTAAGPRGLVQARKDGIYLIENGNKNLQSASRQSETLLLPLPLTINSRWQTTVTTELLEWRKHTLEAADRNPAYNITIDFSCTSLDAEVKTPAGTFSNVAVISGSGERRIEIGGTRDRSTIRVEITEWYAQGIGLIQRERRETTDNQLLNSGSAKMVLERID